MHFKDFLACHHDIPSIILLCANNQFGVNIVQPSRKVK